MAPMWMAMELEVKELGWGWGTKFADMDHDGRSDILMVNGLRINEANYYLRNTSTDGQLSFVDAYETSGFRQMTKSISLEVFDYDNDGDLDALISNFDKEPLFFDNQLINIPKESDPNWLQVSLEGVGSNRNGFGSRIDILLPDGKTLSRYYTGVGLMAQSLTPVHFGVGDFEIITELKISWPNGEVDTYYDVSVNKIYRAVENTTLEVLALANNKTLGCTDPNSCSYNPLATSDDGSCSYLDSKQIESNTSLGVFNKEAYSYPALDGNRVMWRIEGGEILAGQGTTTVEVLWHVVNSGTLSATEQGTCYSRATSLTVSMRPQSQGESDYSIARMWTEVLLDAIRRDLARPTVHARNLFHTSALIYDVWQLFEQEGQPFIQRSNHEDLVQAISFILEDVLAEAREAISHAVARLIYHRFQNSPGKDATHASILTMMKQLGYDFYDRSEDFSDGNAAAIGNYLAKTMIEYGYADGSREEQQYSNAYYKPVNTPLAPQLPGNPICEDPNRWQPLSLVPLSIKVETSWM